MKYRFQKPEQIPILSGHLKMGGENPKGETITVNNRYLMRNGKPWIPVMGEYQFARASRADWSRELAKMKAGGINVVSTYVIWLYHEEQEGELKFDGDLDLRAFVLACQETGMDVFLRIGPWIHGECRNGGFPDWLMSKPYTLRSNDPAYLAQAEHWYTAVYSEIQGLLYKDGGNIIGVQIENELQHDEVHLATLKQMAIACGFDVPLYTVTGWSLAPGGTEMPQDEFLPVYGGYCEMPWAHQDGPLEPSNNYFFAHIRNDSGIGSDLQEKREDFKAGILTERYPYVTCELGGGVQVSHHRRVIVRPMDIYALAMTKIGDGNRMPGYYLYHGSTNKVGKKSTFQESIASGYPNDYTILNYDFQAPLSQYGESRGSYGLLNMQNLFVRDFAGELAGMQTARAEYDPGRYDNVSLRYVMQTDGESGFVFVNHYQRGAKLADLEDVVFDTGNVVFPKISVKGDVAFYIPFNMKIGESVLECATVQPVCRTEDTYFFAEIPGVEALYRFADGSEKNRKAGKDSVFTVGGIKIVTLTWEEARYLRKLDDGKIYLGDGCDVYWFEQQLRCIQEGIYTCFCWEDGSFTEKTVGKEKPALTWKRECVKTLPFTPTHSEELEIGGPRKLTFEKLLVDEANGFIEIQDKYDVAQIYADGELVADNYYYGMPWRVPAKMLFEKECYLVMSEMKDDFYREF